MTGLDTKLELKAKRNKATAIYGKVGDHRIVAERMGITVRDAYKLVDDGLDDELRGIKGIPGEDWDALNMREYLRLKTRLDSMITAIGDEFDAYYAKDGSGRTDPNTGRAKFPPLKDALLVVGEMKRLIMAMDEHLERTGKFIRKTEVHFSWNDPNLMDDPEFRNFFEVIKDFLKSKGIDPIEFLDYVDLMIRRKGSVDISDIKGEAVDVAFEDVQKDDTTQATGIQPPSTDDAPAKPQ